MTRGAHVPSFALAASLALLGSSISNQQALTHYTFPSEPPSFDILLRAEPIVVLARVGDIVGISKKTFETVPGDIDRAPAFTEEYHNYRLRTVRLLKGNLPESFEVRVISGTRNHILLDRARGQEILLVLAPDSGMDPQSRPRDTFLITHGAAYLVREGRFQAAGERGPETWSIERAADVIGRFQREREQQRADSPEPRDAAVAVFSGEDRPDRAEPAPPEAPKLRKGEALPADLLAKAAPKAIEGAGDDPKLDRMPPIHIGPERRSQIQLDAPLEFRPRRVPSGDVGSHACLSGSYNYPYETTGITGREGWLCCIRVDEILRESFQCAGGTLPRPFGSPEYIKIRYCSLLHPTASEPTYIPVCIPAPLQAPGLH